MFYIFVIMFIALVAGALAIVTLLTKNSDLKHKCKALEAGIDFDKKQNAILAEQLKEAIEQRDEAHKNVKYLEIEWMYKYHKWLTDNLETANHNISAYKQRWKKE